MATRMNAKARETLRAAGFGQAEWARLNYFQDGRWGGDECGCPDDRCIGYHHDKGEECGCLRALLDEHRRSPAGEPAVVRAAEFGHRVEPDPPAGMTAAIRWTCPCGATVIKYGRNIYGSAVERRCTHFGSPAEPVGEDEESE